MAEEVKKTTKNVKLDYEKMQLLVSDCTRK